MGSVPVEDIQTRSLSAYGRTSTGRIREHNEDSFVLADLSQRARVLEGGFERTAVGPEGLLFAVCDGMGGAAAGEVASALAIEHLYERMVDSTLPAECHDDLARRLITAVEVSNERVFEKANASPALSGMGTTMTAAGLFENVLMLAQVGDSRAYVFRRGALTQVTEDQSLVNQLIASGDLSPEDIPSFKYSSVILQALGTSPGVYVDLSSVELVDGDRVLICSDGLSGMLDAGSIATILETGEDPEKTSSTLIKRANAAGGHDNITAIVIHFFGDPSAPPCEAIVQYSRYELPGYTKERPWDGLAQDFLLQARERALVPGKASRARSRGSSKGGDGSVQPDSASHRPETWGAGLKWLFLLVLVLIASLVLASLANL